MTLFMFSREIAKREAINEYGRQGVNTHKEAIYIAAEDLPEAKKKLQPFNWKKHIRFKFERTYPVDYIDWDQMEQIVDLGVVESFEEWSKKWCGTFKIIKKH